MLFLVSTVYALLCICISGSFARYLPPCPLLGPDFPAPKSPSRSPAIQKAKAAATSAIEAAIKTGKTKFGNMNAKATSFSVDVYSTHEEGSLLEFQHSAPALSKPKSGVSKVDANTIYRIGSISKVLTVYIYLASAGDISFNEPITKYVPEFAEYAAQHPERDTTLNTWDFNAITIGSLAAQLSGLPRDPQGAYGIDDILRQLSLPAEPRTPANISGAHCRDTDDIPCTRAAFLQNLMSQNPVFAPFHRPAYSNTAFGVLALALERITKKPLQALFKTHLVDPLGLNATFYNEPPTPDHGIIPFDKRKAFWTVNFTTMAAAGNFYSSTSDFQKIGRAILESKLIPPAVTRRWLEPVTFADSARHAVGAPWEIYKAPSNVGKDSWMFVKEGGIGLYSTTMALMPDYRLGFTVFAAGRDCALVRQVVSDIVADVMLAAFEQAAKEEARANFEGTYRDDRTNSMLVLEVDDLAGIGVTTWTANGTNMHRIFAELLGFSGSVLRLYPSGLRSENGREVGYRVVAYPRDQQYVHGAISTNCLEWTSVDEVIYGGIGLDEFSFKLDSARRRAVAAEPRAFRVQLPRIHSV